MTAPRFGLQADRYRRFRPGYPDWVFDLALEACGKSHDLAVELGAGSGQATGPILERFGRVIAVEPDPDMAALIPPHHRLELRVEPAEAFTSAEPIDAAISATAFHWMDHRAVGAMLARALRPGGVFLCFGYGPFVVTGPEDARRVIETDSALWSRHVDPRLSGWRPYPDLLAESGVFASIQPLDFSFERDLAPEDAAGLFLTTSYASAHALESGDEEGYCADLATRMRVAAREAPVRVGFVVTGALARL